MMIFNSQSIVVKQIQVKKIKNSSILSFNIQHLISLASSHGILPLVYKTIKDLPNDNSSSSLIQHFLLELKTQNMIIAQRNMLMSAELIRIMKLLKENKVEALAFKGPTLSQMVYGDITLRQYSDLDILVNEEEITKAGSILAKHGYDPSFPIKILENKTCLSATNDLGFYNQTSGLLIELHWKLFREKIGKHLHFHKSLRISKMSISMTKQSQRYQAKCFQPIYVYMVLNMLLNAQSGSVISIDQFVPRQI